MSHSKLKKKKKLLEGGDVVVYLKCDMVLTLDEFSKKVVSLTLDNTLTEVRSLDFNL